MKNFKCIFLVFVFSISVISNVNSEPQSLIQKIERSIENIQKNTGINVYYQGLPDNVYTPAQYEFAQKKDLKRLAQFLDVVEQELLYYPECFFRNTNLKNIVIVKKFFYKGKMVEGTFQYKEETIFLDFARHPKNIIMQSHNLHHELFHLIEFHMGVFMKTWKDEKWDAISAEHEEYLGKAEAFIAGESRKHFLAPEKKGFATPYAQVSAREDKAEIFACLMVPSQHKILLKWMEDDPILSKKVEYLKSYIHRFCNEMDGGFWQNVLTR